MTRMFVSLICSAVILAAPQDAASARAEVQGYLSKSGFAAEEIAELETGKAIARAQITGNEIVAIAAVKVRVPRDRVVEYYTQLISYADGTVTLAFGRVGVPPAPDDLKDLAFDADEVADL